MNKFYKIVVARNYKNNFRLVIAGLVLFGGNTNWWFGEKIQ